MPVLVTTYVPLDISVYDQISPHLTPKLRTATGFLAHAAHAEQPGAFTVVEIWDRAEDHAAFFDNAVKPNLPTGVRTTVSDLHNTIVS